MNRRRFFWSAALALVLLLLGTQVSAAPLPGQVRFTAVGDFGAGANTGAVLGAIAASDSDFTMTLGDLSYGTPGQEQAWCDFVTSRVGADYPFELLSGNHESNGLNGDINNFARCLPDRLPGSVGTYGRQYYVDVPADNPIVRFVAISPGLTFPDGNNSYAVGSARYLWTAQAIDSARAAGIPWVVASMHKPCVTVGRYTCESTAAVFNLLLAHQVDLVLSGHEHSYQRSHQLGLGPGCPELVPGTYTPGCVVDTDSAFVQGRGTVAMVVGTGGITPYDVNAADAEAPYFAKYQGANAGAAYGALQVNATDTSLQASYLRAAGGALSDSFTITRSATSNTAPTASFTPTCAAMTCAFDASASRDPDGTIASYAWSFGDGGTATGPKPSHTFVNPGSYTVHLTVTDDDGATGSTNQNVTATAPVTPLVSDQFTRTVASGWGSAPTGGAWTVPSGNTVAGGYGNLTVAKGAAPSANLRTVSLAGANLVSAVKVDKAATGSGLYVGHYVRRTSAGSYSAKVRYLSTGAVTLALNRVPTVGSEVILQGEAAVPGLSYTVGDTLNVRVQAVGKSPTVLRAKLWEAGTPEPTTWLRTATDNTAGMQADGWVGIGAYLSSAATTTPLTVKVDQLTVTAP